MSTRFVTVDRDTPMLLPPDLRDWVQQDDLVHFLVDALPLLDLSTAAVNARGTGSAQYPPGLMLGLLVYCYANGVFSSRQIERATYQNLSVRYWAANTHPDHDTIAHFRRTNAPLLRTVFVQLLQLARRAGLLRLGIVALDGTKLAANATKRQTLTAAQLATELQHLERRVQELLQQAEQADAHDDSPAALPAELCEIHQRRARLQRAQAELRRHAQTRHAQREAQRQAQPARVRRPHVSPAPRPTDTVNLTDPDSTLTPTAQQRYIQGYNAQLAVSVADVGLIVAADVVRDTNDSQQLAPMVTQVVANTGVVPTQTLVDSGYENHWQLHQVEQRYGLEVLCPPAHSAKARADVRPRGRWRQHCKAKREALRVRLRTAEGRALYALRGQTVEPTIGILKSALGFTRFRLRGLDAVRSEWLLVSLAFNCKRLAGRWP